MSLAAVQDRVSNFLNSNEPQIISLSGKWGAGKTFLWFKMYEAARKNKKLNYPNYSYISLFGVNGLSELKIQIGANLKKNTNSDEDLENIRNQSESLFYKTKAKAESLLSGFSLSYGGVSIEVANLLNGLSYYGLGEAVICFDDIERRGKELNLVDILGVASQLKQEKKCKVILIFNTDEFDQKDKDIWNRYHEKVIDYEISLELTSTEATNIAFDNTDKITNIVRECSNKLELQNIRLLKKILRYSMEFASFLEENGCGGDVVESGIKSLVLFMACRYGQGTV